MSDLKEDTMAAIQKVADLEKLKSEVQEKRAIYDNKVLTSKLESIKQNEKDLEIAKSANYGAHSQEEVDKIVRDNDEYMAAAQTPMVFICDSFKDVVPFFRKNLILVGAKTGEGKSTAVANIAYTNLIEKSKKTGKTLRTLVITNEEKREDFYNRITSLIKGWHYTNHSKFSEEQRKEFSRMIPILSASGRLTVIDNNHGGSHGVTTTIEGIEALFNKLIEDKEYYDVVLIDYYQNIMSSKLNPAIDQYKIQEKVSRLLDNMKNNYPAPIVVFAQLKSQNVKDEAPFQLRLMGSKSIIVPSTLAIEMVIDRKNSRTKWIVHKSRYTEAIGKDFFTGYDKGRFVKYTNDFVERIQRMALDKESTRINQAIDKSNGLPDVFKTAEDKTEDKK